MTASSTTRDLIFDQLRRSRASVRNVLAAAPSASLSRYRDSGRGWTVTEVLCHLRDFESIFLQRARLTATADFPDLPFPDPDQLASENDYAAEEAWPAFEDWGRRRRATLDFLAKLPDAAGERAGNHPTRGRFTLDQQLILTACHDVNHLEQITRILSEQIE